MYANLSEIDRVRRVMSNFVNRARFRRDHRWAPAQMSDYLDGELLSDRRIRIERHVRECEECRRLLAGLREVLAALRCLPVPKGGADAAQVAAAVRMRLTEPTS
jgi:anti-sigma factor RsiW